MYNVTLEQLEAIREYVAEGWFSRPYLELSEAEARALDPDVSEWARQLTDAAVAWPDWLGTVPTEYTTERLRRTIRLAREARREAAVRQEEVTMQTLTWDDFAGTLDPIVQMVQPNPVPVNPLSSKKRQPVGKEAVIRKLWPNRHGDPSPEEMRKRWTLSLPIVKFPYDHCIGLEIEVEGLIQDNSIITPTHELFMVVPDGSLRGGVEYITNYGAKAADVVTYLPQLDKLWRQREFSHRCGVHVHVDVGAHTLEDLYKVFLIYSVVEPLLFYISGNRHDNKFCVAVQDCHSSCAEAIHFGHEGDWEEFKSAIDRGTKYMAMNILTVRRYNTLEFRHHEGTVDPKRITEWLLVLLDLVVHCKGLATDELTQEILTMNTDSKYLLFLRKYFPNSHRLLSSVDDFERKMYRGVGFVKECFANEPPATNARLRELED